MELERIKHSNGNLQPDFFTSVKGGFTSVGGWEDYAQTSQAEVLCVPSVFFLVSCSMFLVPFFVSFFSA
ncbi:MAG: hypothetical protein LBL13_13055, partial [Bacteroidales bacterium]|nr:hypothetical protein [Bacteroidales bacterium]